MSSLTIQSNLPLYNSTKAKVIDKNILVEKNPPKTFVKDVVKITTKVGLTGASTLVATGIPLLTTTALFKSNSLGLVGAGVVATSTATSMLVSALGVESKTKGAAVGSGYGVLGGLALGGLVYAFEKNSGFLLASTAVGLLGGSLGGVIGAYSNNIVK